VALRLIEAYIPQVSWEAVEEIVAEKPLLSAWHEESDNGYLHLRILIPYEESSPVLDLLEQRFSHVEGFQMIVLPVEASIPRPEAPEEKPPEEEPAAADAAARAEAGAKVAREELYEDIAETAKPCRTYLLMVALSAIVAGIGILRNNTAIIIGAMVIAPLLGPNVALALATTLADGTLARRALKALGEGILVVLLISVLWGLVMKVDPAMPGMPERIQVGPGDSALALASGCAGVLAFTTGAPATLVGVMVAVALLPPLVTCGLLLGSGHWTAAQGALLVFLTNIICVNLSGIVTFLFQGVRPLTWWETQKAKRATRIAIAIWVLLLLALSGMILLSQN